MYTYIHISKYIHIYLNSFNLKGLQKGGGGGGRWRAVAHPVQEKIDDRNAKITKVLHRGREGGREGSEPLRPNPKVNNK